VDADPERVDDDFGDAAPPERPLPPPPTIPELFAVCRERFALRHPRFDATRAVLAVAALVGLGGLCWVQFGSHRTPVTTEPVPLAGPSTVVTTAAAATVPAARATLVAVTDVTKGRGLILRSNRGRGWSKGAKERATAPPPR
jgi:hypothetical protein